MSTDRRVITADAEPSDGMGGLVPVGDVGVQFVTTVAQAKQRVKELQEFIASVMVEGVDFGKIPGTPKPTLYKPGAEKLAEIYGLAPTTEVVNRVEDWQDGFFHYEVRVRLVHKRTGVVVAEGIGSCNSKEKRYRNQDQFTIVNTILKMAKKRALIDATLSATRSSGTFTQDVEDLVDVEDRRPTGTRGRPGGNEVAAAVVEAARKTKPFEEQTDEEKVATIRKGFRQVRDANAEALSAFGIPDIPEQASVEEAKRLGGLLRDVLKQLKTGDSPAAADVASSLNREMAAIRERASEAEPF